MNEKRKHKRFVLEAELIMERLDGQSMAVIPISVNDVSKSGIGFSCSELLELNSVYKAKLKIWTGDILDTFINIVRLDNSGDENVYGAIFIGMNDNDSSRIKIYELFEEAKDNE